MVFHVNWTKLFPSIVLVNNYHVYTYNSNKTYYLIQSFSVNIHLLWFIGICIYIFQIENWRGQEVIIWLQLSTTKRYKCIYCQLEISICRYNASNQIHLPSLYIVTDFIEKISSVDNNHWLLFSRVFSSCYFTCENVIFKIALYLC